MYSPLVKLLQVEFSRNGTNAYKPDPSFQNPSYQDITTAQTTLDMYPNISSHATAVANYWRMNGAAALVKQWQVCEATCFQLKGTTPESLEAGVIFDPLPADYHIAILPFGENATWTVEADAKLAEQAEKGNALVIVSPPDNDGSGTFYSFPCNAKSPNILRAASTLTGSYINYLNEPEIYFPIGWNSYVQPALCSIGPLGDMAPGIISIFDWVLQSGVFFKAADIKTLILSSADTDSHGRRIFNGTAALDAVRNYYATASTTPPPAPTQTLPSSTTTSQQSSQSMSTPPTITKFTASNAWSGPTTKTTVSFASNGDSGILTDSNGIQLQVAGSGTEIIDTLSDKSGPYGNKADWYFQAIKDGVVSAKAHLILNGKFNATQVAAAAAQQLATQPMQLTPDQQCASIANQLAISYANGTFGAVPVIKVAPLATLLQQAGLG